jgi:SNF2 family DNA or RNA helicase
VGCVQNNLHELWALLNFLLPEVFTSAEKFDEWFGSGNSGNETEVVQQLHKVRSATCHCVLFVLRPAQSSRVVASCVVRPDLLVDRA